MFISMLMYCRYAQDGKENYYLVFLVIGELVRCPNHVGLYDQLNVFFYCENDVRSTTNEILRLQRDSCSLVF
jgi:hypothetical protein